MWRRFVLVALCLFPLPALADPVICTVSGIPNTNGAYPDDSHLFFTLGDTTTNIYDYIYTHLPNPKSTTRQWGTTPSNTYKVAPTTNTPTFTYTSGTARGRFSYSNSGQFVDFTCGGQNPFTPRDPFVTGSVVDLDLDESFSTDFAVNALNEHSCSIASGSLPTGLTYSAKPGLLYNASCTRLSGTATVAGVFSWVTRYTDDTSGEFVDMPYSITVTDASPPEEPAFDPTQAMGEMMHIPEIESSSNYIALFGFFVVAFASLMLAIKIGKRLFGRL